MAESYIVGSETLPTKSVGNNAQEPFQATGDYTHTFTKPMTGFSIKNKGSQDLEFIINNYKFPVDAGESFEAQFHPFTKVQIIGQTTFKAFGMSTGGVATFVIVDEAVIPSASRPSVVFGNTATNKYRGSQILMKKTKALRQVKAHSNATGWQIWESASNGHFVTKLKEGIFAGADNDGFLVADLDVPLILESGKYYTIVNSFGDTASYYFVWTTYSGAGSGSVAFPTESDSFTATGNSAQSGIAFVPGGSGVTPNFVYDFKLGLADA